MNALPFLFHQHRCSLVITQSSLLSSHLGTSKHTDFHCVGLKNGSSCVMHARSSMDHLSLLSSSSVPSQTHLLPTRPSPFCLFIYFGSAVLDAEFIYMESRSVYAFVSVSFLSTLHLGDLSTWQEAVAHFVLFLCNSPLYESIAHYSFVLTVRDERVFPVFGHHE